MSQKKAKMINKFIKATGKEKAGVGFSTTHELENGQMVTRRHVLMEKNRIKKAYAGANLKQKAGLSIVMLTVIKKSNGKTN